MARGAKSTEDQNIKILDCYNVKPLIYRGEQAKLKEFPHMVIVTNFIVLRPFLCEFPLTE